MWDKLSSLRANKKQNLRCYTVVSCMRTKTTGCCCTLNFMDFIHACSHTLSFALNTHFTPCFLCSVNLDSEKNKTIHMMSGKLMLRNWLRCQVKPIRAFMHVRRSVDGLIWAVLLMVVTLSPLHCTLPKGVTSALSHEKLDWKAYMVSSK